MPDWILGPISVIALVGFIFYAFWQGMKVNPDRSKSNVGPTRDDIWLATRRDSEGNSL